MLKVGDLVEILEPEDMDNYHFGWNSDMNELIGHKTKVRRVFIGHQGKLAYRLENNTFTWCESNLKLIDKNEDNTIIELNETVVVTKGENMGKIDKVVDCFAKDGQIHYVLHDLRYRVSSDYVKPIKHLPGLF